MAFYKEQRVNNLSSAMQNVASPTLSDLRRSLAEAALRTGPAATGRVGFGAAEIDAALSGGLERAALHEIYAAGAADVAAATGFALGLALRAVQGEAAGSERPILWARQDFVDAETGRLHAPGLNELGLDPARLLLVRARDAEGVLRAGAEGARCPALGAVLIEPWGEPRAFDLTASRRLSLAAEGSGVPVLLLRVAAAEAPSAARTRWQVRALASRALEANAPGVPAFALRLLRQRGGAAEREWRVEWDRDRRTFAERSLFDRSDRLASRTDHAAPLSRPLVPLSGDGQVAADGCDSGLRRVG
ncbi:Protein ImuA OS=Bosea thiooxidans OX=53254 GN=SAMN05660750_03793 PE=4 SV=1 [Bosea thiooxidans]|uniref:Protein ImuA n=1 Tax=Bosea thiooxidans TaxID=53254 RepID=A0A1T5G5Q9_9HYPH|nr:protein ImuA [Bosea thiooxidans]